MNAFARLLGRDGHKYTLLGQRQHGEAPSSLWTRKHSVLAMMLIAFAALAIFVSR